MPRESAGQTEKEVIVADHDPRLIELREELAHNRTRLLYFIRKKLLKYQDEELAEDLTQSALEKAVKGIRTFRGDSKLFSWLCRIAIHETFGYFRKQKKRIVFPLFGADDTAAAVDDNRDGEVSVDRAPNADKAVDLVDLERAVKKLSSDDRDAIQLLGMGHTTEEIADILGISLAAAKSRIHRARERLSGFYKSE